MLNIDTRHPFKACWNEHNGQLNPDRGSFLERNIRKLARFIFCLLNIIVAACFNPRSASRFYPFSNLNNNSGNFTKKIITPDQVPLFANIHIVKGAVAETPTIILFNPLGANQSIHYGIKESLIERNCNVITFDYRGLGTTGRAEDLVIDGESIYQYVTQELGTNKDKVHIYGFSLGGVLAAQVKALHPESAGRFVADRSFKSVFSLITENCCIERLGFLVKKITSLISAIFIAYPVYLLGWEWDGKKALNKLSGKITILYHPNDCLVPFKANLASQCSNKDIVALNPSERGASTHFCTLNGKNTADGKDAVAFLADILSK